MTRIDERVVRALVMTSVFVLCAGLVARATEPDLRLVDAVKRGDDDAVRSLLAAKADVKAVSGDGTTALHWAVYHGDMDTTDRLIRAGAPVNAANDLGITPLFLASSQEDARIARRLLAAGADPNLSATLGESPLMVASRTGRVEIVSALLAAKADVNARERTHDQTPLMWASATKHPAVVQALIKGGADLTARSKVRRRKSLILTSRQASYNPGAYEQHVKNGDIVEVDEGGFTALLFAAQQGDVESTRLLLDAGADVNDTVPAGMTALVVAAYSNHSEAVAFLLEQGADPNRSAAGFTALHTAILRGSLEMVQSLLSHKADPNLPIVRANGARRQSADFAFGRGLVGASPAYLAAKFAEIPILRALSAAGADLKFKMPDGATLMMAAMDIPETDSGDVEGLGRDRRDRYVFFRRAHTKSPDEFSVQTPEEVEREVLEIVRTQVTAGADVNAADSEGETALHFAAAKGLNGVIQFLVSNGAVVNAKNGRRQTPLDIAEQPRSNRGGDQLGNQATTVTLLRSLGGTEGGEPVPDFPVRRRAR
jgi:cytohesin